MAVRQEKASGSAPCQGQLAVAGLKSANTDSAAEVQKRFESSTSLRKVELRHRKASKHPAFASDSSGFPARCLWNWWNAAELVRIRWMELLSYLSHPLRSSSQRAAEQSLGILQSARGERVTEPIFGPSGRQERLNCWLKNRRTKVVRQVLICSLV